MLRTSYKAYCKNIFLDKNMVIVNITEVNKLINGIIMTIEQDIHSIQQALE